MLAREHVQQQEAARSKVHLSLVIDATLPPTLISIAARMELVPARCTFLPAPAEWDKVAAASLAVHPSVAHAQVQRLLARLLVS